MTPRDGEKRLISSRVPKVNTYLAEPVIDPIMNNELVNK
jgi:hypothetical protein